MPKRNSRKSVQVYRYSDGSGYSRNMPTYRTKIKPKIPYFRHIMFLLIVTVLVIFSINFLASRQKIQNSPSLNGQLTIKNAQYCRGNQDPSLIVVSVSRRHLWACNLTNQIYDSVVITGNENLASDKTPVGKYKIYNKITDIDLIGSNAQVNWNDHVKYWMPFLQNQFGVYGFHDATWRNDSAFGKVSPYSIDASHGCVELPLTTAAWVYNWANIGTNVSIVK
jgi:hypothetical protein